MALPGIVALIGVIVCQIIVQFDFWKRRMNRVNRSGNQHRILASSGCARR
jgi:hypothetical protein